MVSEQECQPRLAGLFFPTEGKKEEKSLVHRIAKPQENKPRARKAL
tara:strand:- start:201 stop:338 length:138 start_codon:yes stop_codon:yes gene_type:complete